MYVKKSHVCLSDRRRPCYCSLNPANIPTRHVYWLGELHTQCTTQLNLSFKLYTLVVSLTKGVLVFILTVCWMQTPGWYRHSGISLCCVTQVPLYLLLKSLRQLIKMEAGKMVPSAFQFGFENLYEGLPSYKIMIDNISCNIWYPFNLAFLWHVHT